jgi:hypothetical protein
MPMLSAGLTACTTTTSNDCVRPDMPLPEGFEIACEGDFDATPARRADAAVDAQCVSGFNFNIEA